MPWSVVFDLIPSAQTCRQEYDILLRTLHPSFLLLRLDWLSRMPRTLLCARSCTADGAESCTKCNPGFEMQQKNGHDVCAQPVQPAPDKCVSTRYSSGTAAYVTDRGDLCSNIARRHTDVRVVTRLCSRCCIPRGRLDFLNRVVLLSRFHH